MDPSLYKAAASGYVGFLRRKDGTVVATDLLHQKTPKHNNILHIAAEFKQTDFFKNVDPDQFDPLFWATNKKGDTPLHIASRVGCVEIVKLLIKHANETPSLEGADDEESVLIDDEAHKQPLRVTNLQKDTAMHVAVRCGHLEVVTLLMKADPQLCCLTNHADESPLFLATRQGFHRVACFILNECPISPSFQGTNGVTALHAAVTHPWGVAGLIEIMVSKNPGVIKAVDALGWTPLHYAALKEHSYETEVLLKADSSAAYVLDNSGWSALHVAACAGSVHVMKEVIRCRPDTCDLLNHKDQTVLHAAALGGQASVVKYILKTPMFAGLINEVDEDGNTPLHLAVIHKCPEVIRILAKDPRVNKKAINNKLFQPVDTILSDDLFKLDARTPALAFCLGRSTGVPYFHEQILHDCIKVQSPEEETSSTPAIADERQNLKANSDELKKFDTNLLVAMLIATVTFTAAFTMPGGFRSDGTAILQDRPAFLVFLLFDALSFFLSILVVFSQFMWVKHFKKYLDIDTIYIQFSIVGMLVAFASAIYVVLPKGNRLLGVMVYVICGLLGLSFICVYFFMRNRHQRKMTWLRTRRF